MMESEEKKNDLVPFERTEYAKSNILIGAKFKSSLLENQIMAIGLYMIANGEFCEESGRMTVTIYASQLRKQLGLNKGSFYQLLDKTSKRMTGRVIGISNPQTQSFEYHAIVTDCEYSNGIYKIMFNNTLRNYIQGLDKNFTLLSLPTMLNFHSVYSFRLYELLKSHAFFPKNAEKKEKIFHVEFGVVELKMNLGIINIESDKVKTHLLNSKAPDFEKIGELAPEQQFRRWTDFRELVIETAIKEINEVTEDMLISADYIVGGKGSSVRRVMFVVDLETKGEKNSELTVQEEEPDIPEKRSQEEILEAISDLIEEPVKYKDLVLIASSADYDYDLIKRAYQITRAKAEENGLDDFVGYFIGVIRGGAREKIRIEPKKKQVVTKSAQAYLNRYSQREYSEDEMLEIEKTLFKKEHE